MRWLLDYAHCIHSVYTVCTVTVLYVYYISFVYMHSGVKQVIAMSTQKFSLHNALDYSFFLQKRFLVIIRRIHLYIFRLLTDFLKKYGKNEHIDFVFDQSYFVYRDLFPPRNLL